MSTTKAREAAQQCQLPPSGWRCTRIKGHDGPCAALPYNDTQAELKPCPHCGGKAEYDPRRWNGITPVTVEANTGHAIYCAACPLPTVGGCLQFETYEEAKEHWNRRAIDAAIATSSEE